jgi:hypothetical protein
MSYRPFVSLVLSAAALTGCDPGPLEPTYQNVAGIFDSSCSFNSCHGGTRGSSRLNFDAAREDGILYTDLLVGVPACQYDRMPLIDPGHPENSWLYIKITHAHDADGYLTFTPADDWEPGITPDDITGLYPRSTCPLTEDGVLIFGEIMPDGSSNGLDERRATAIREWIEMGAPGPDGTPTPPRDAGMRDAPTPADAGAADAPAIDSGELDAGAPDTGELDAP